MEQGFVELKESSVIEDDVEKRIRTTGVRGLDFEKAKELGFFTRISNLLCATHASIMAAYRIYGGVDYLLTNFGGRKNEIAREMGVFEKSFTRFVNFWTSYYAHGGAGIEVNEETEVLFRRIMDWAQLPMKWELGDKQRVEDEGLDVAIRINLDNGKQYTFKTTTLKEDIVGDDEETWCVTKYDTKEHKQTTVEENMDKASAMMVAKRLSSEDCDNIYTASRVREYMERKTEIVPFKAYKENQVVGSLTKVQK